MALVDKQQKILREIVQQRGGHTAWRPAGQHGRIVLDALAHPHFIEHLNIIVCPLGDALRLNELALGGKLPYLGVTLCTDLLQRSGFFLGADDIVAGGKDRHVLDHVLPCAGDWVELCDAVDLVAKNSTRMASSLI